MSKNISISEEKLKNIIRELEEIAILITDVKIKNKINNIIKSIGYIDDNLSEKSIINMIYEKMKEYKITNPDLNAKLYIIYRDIENNKITAEKAYDLYKEVLLLETYNGENF